MTISQRFKIVESIPDKNGIIIIAIKPDKSGQFGSRDEALHSLYPVSTRQPGQYQCGDNCKGECSGEVDGIVHCPYNPQAEREKVLDELRLEINRVSLTGFTKYTYRKWILEKLRQEGKGGE